MIAILEGRDDGAGSKTRLEPWFALTRRWSGGDSNCRSHPTKSLVSRPRRATDREMQLLLQLVEKTTALNVSLTRAGEVLKLKCATGQGGRCGRPGTQARRTGDVTSRYRTLRPRGHLISSAGKTVSSALQEIRQRQFFLFPFSSLTTARSRACKRTGCSH